MDGSDWAWTVYLGVAVLSFPFLVRWMWREELTVKRNNRLMVPSLGVAGSMAFSLAFFWPIMLVLWVLRGLLELITFDMEK